MPLYGDFSHDIDDLVTGVYVYLLSDWFGSLGFTVDSCIGYAGRCGGDDYLLPANNDHERRTFRYATNFEANGPKSQTPSLILTPTPIRP